MTTSPGWTPATPFITNSPGWNDTTKDPIDVRLGGIRLRTDYSVRQDHGWEASLDTISGWWDSVDDMTTVLDHPSGDGFVAGTTRLDRRLITLTGVIESTKDFGPGSVQAAADTLRRMKRATLVVDETRRGLAREVDCRIRVAIGGGPAPWLASYVVSAVADDPLLYNAGTRPLTSGVLANRGDMTAWPIVELVGPHSALAITHPGGTWTLPALGSGVQRTVDCRNGRVFDADGVRVFGVGAGSGPWPRVPAGGGEWTVSGLGSGAARLRRWEAWS